MSHLHTEGVVEHLEYLKFSVLVALVLKYFLDGYCFARLSYDCLEDHTERAIANDFLSVVSEVLGYLIAKSQSMLLKLVTYPLLFFFHLLTINSYY